MKSVIVLFVLSILSFVQQTSRFNCDEEALEQLWKICDYTREHKTQRNLYIEKNTPIAVRVLGTSRFIGGEFAVLYTPASSSAYNFLIEQKEGLYLHYKPEKDFVGVDSLVVLHERALSDIKTGTPQKKTVIFTTYHFTINDSLRFN